ncbi:TonB-dependent siderophore receptor [Novosphingobium sp. 9]|uniref:TonB-dependent siderophore receptor n=1 Tax=Novosphingobium sp. 9 TaxID=2025349 RepID=UPI0021B50CF0|nr:TonB-dependent receptor plug domain-containing protein [Novosphingobium sp. 9]
MKLGFAPSRRGALGLVAAMLAGTALSTPALAEEAGVAGGNAPVSSDAATAAAVAVTAAPAPAAPPPADDDSSDGKEIIVKGSLGALPTIAVSSVFGFNKTIAETPRSVSSVTSEQMERFGITQIYDLVSQAPGIFTSSFFGTGGALDIRGAPSDVYFRGMLRLDNPGNYSTPIGAAERIDIVRGPASVIYGPSKIGGYMNFIPKTAREANGDYSDDTTGFVSYDGGSWSRNVMKANVTGPGKIGDHEFGYSIYGEVEHSGSYYNNVFTHNALFSASFDTDITSNLRTEFGAMYQKYNSVQNSGWNRVTQDLVDHGTYITGEGTQLDTSGDGKISREEAAAANGGAGLTFYGSYACGGDDTSAGYSNACLLANPDLNLQNAGTTHISGKQTLTGQDDRLNNRQKTAYFDLIWTGAGNLQITNKMFYDGGKNLNENAYGFAQAFNSYVMEDKLVISDRFDTKAAKISLQLSPSVRYTHFHFADDYGVELWNRPDITVGYDATSTRLLATECDCDYSDYVIGHYTDYGIAGLVDLDFNMGLDVIGGIRYDSVHAKSTAILSKYAPGDIAGNVGDYGDDMTPSESGTEGGVSWNVSVSYKTPVGLIPYFTISRQSTVVAGEGSELYLANIKNGAVLGKSKLMEGGLKGEFLDKKLYAAVSVYKQQRTAAAAESSLTNQILQTKGIEAEMRWAVDRHLLVTGAFTHMKVYNIGAYNAGYYFNYFGAEDMIAAGADPALSFGGSEFGNVYMPTKGKARRPGEPTNVASATATYAFDNGIAINGDLSHVDSVYADYAQNIKLPAYWLLNLGASYTTGPWLFRAVVKNVNNARYFRAGGQDLFGADIVLPQLPRSWQATIEYKF